MREVTREGEAVAGLERERASVQARADREMAEWADVEAEMESLTREAEELS